MANSAILTPYAAFVAACYEQHKIHHAENKVEEKAELEKAICFPKKKSITRSKSTLLSVLALN